MLSLYATATMPPAVRDLIEETAAAIAEHHRTHVAQAEAALLAHCPPAAMDRLEDALTAYHTDLLNALVSRLTRAPASLSAARNDAGG